MSAGEATASEPRLSPARRWRVLFVRAFLPVALAAFGHFFLRMPSASGFGAILTLAGLASPILWIAAARGAGGVVALNLHLALYAAALIVAWTTSQPGHGSLADSLVPFFFMLHAAPAAISAIVSALTAGRAPPTFWPLFLGVLAGWCVGVGAWAATVPFAVIPAAEAAAGDQPYCLRSSFSVVSRRLHLMPPWMLGQHDGNRYWSHHALLVLDGERRDVLQWSYRQGRFTPISDGVRHGLGLDALPSCGPRPYFAQSLPW